MSLSSTVTEIFSVAYWRDLEIWVTHYGCSLVGTIRYLERAAERMSTTDMAAIVKMGCCAGKRSVNVLARLKYLNVVERSFSTCRARVPVVSRLGVCGSYSPVFR